MPTGQVTVPAVSKVLLSAILNVGGNVDLTVRRIRGLLTVGSDQVVATELQVGAFGIGIFSVTALNAGIASLPDPVTDVESDIWMAYIHIGQQMRFADATGMRPHWTTHYELDTKAMRKVPAGYGIGYIVANSHATHGFSVTLGARSLQSETGA